MTVDFGNLDLISIILGVAVAFAIMIIFYFGKKIFRRKAKVRAANEIKAQILKAHENLQEANKIYNELYQFFDNLEELERRLDK